MDFCPLHLLNSSRDPKTFHVKKCLTKRTKIGILISKWGLKDVVEFSLGAKIQFLLQMSSFESFLKLTSKLKIVIEK